MSPRRGRSLLVLCLLSLGCGDAPTAPPLPDEAVPMRRPAVYAAWWRMVEACSGRRGDLARVRWFSAPAPFEVDGQLYDGYWHRGDWLRGGDRIVLSTAWTPPGDLVRHEMLHALLRRGDHPRAAFVEACGGVVDCGVGCDALGEEGRGVPAGAREVTPAALEISLAVSPAAPSWVADSGWFSLTVTARNPAPEPVWVRLPSEMTFGYVPLMEDGTSGTYRTTAEPRWAFRAGEARRYVFDVHYPPGTYAFEGLFGRQPGPAVTVTVGP